MIKNYFQIPYFVVPFDQHHSLYSEIKGYIDQAEFESSDQITKTDFYLKKPQRYKEFILPFLVKVITDALSVSKVKILDCWFQQYTKFSYHSFHSHDCQWAMVYYLDLPKGSRGTIFQDYLTNLEIEPEVKEGDIIIFPGWLKHKSPTNKGYSTKSIIALNFEIVS